MTLWSITKQIDSQLDKNIDMMKMFELIPVKVQSGDPFALELSLNINENVKKYEFFPTIKCPVSCQEFPVGRLK